MNRSEKKSPQISRKTQKNIYGKRSIKNFEDDVTFRKKKIEKKLIRDKEYFKIR